MSAEIKTQYIPQEFRLPFGDVNLTQIHHKNLRKRLDSLNLAGIPLSPDIELRNRDYFREARVHGILGDDPHNIAIFAAAGSINTENKSMMVLVLPEENIWPLYQDTERKVVYGDNFYVIEEGTIKHIQTTAPLPFVGLVTNYTNGSQYDEFSTSNKVNEQLGTITDDKQKTRELLTEAGVRIPPGFFIPQDQQVGIAEQISEFILQQEDIQGIVVKGTRGSGGFFVSMFGLEDIHEMVEFVNTLQNRGQDVLIEKRILPHPISFPTSEQASFETVVDYNFRVLLTAEENPQVIDTEIRYAPLSNEPVNIAQGAKAIRPEQLPFTGQLEKAFAISRDATQAIYNKLNLTKDGIGFVGTDVIVDTKGDAYIIELNSGKVGGFATLTRLDQKPLDSIKNVFLPAIDRYLPDIDHLSPPNNLHVLPHDGPAQVDVARTYYREKMYSQTARVFSNFLENSNAQDTDYAALGGTYYLDGKYDLALQYSNYALTLNPENSIAFEIILGVHFKRRDFATARDFIDTNYPHFTNPKLDIIVRRAVIELERTKDFVQTIAILRDYDKRIPYDDAWRNAYNLLVDLYEGEVIEKLPNDASSNRI